MEAWKTEKSEQVLDTPWVQVRKDTVSLPNGKRMDDFYAVTIRDAAAIVALDEEGNVILGDEMLTPDSSRFWPLEGYEPGHSQPSFDKQFVRDWLKANPDSNYDLPQDVIDKTIAKYLEAYELLTGKKL